MTLTVTVVHCIYWCAKCIMNALVTCICTYAYSLIRNTSVVRHV